MSTFYKAYVNRLGRLCATEHSTRGGSFVCQTRFATANPGRFQVPSGEYEGVLLESVPFDALYQIGINSENPALEAKVLELIKLRTDERATQRESIMPMTTAQKESFVGEVMGVAELITNKFNAKRDYYIAESTSNPLLADLYAYVSANPAVCFELATAIVRYDTQILVKDQISKMQILSGIL